MKQIVRNKDKGKPIIRFYKSFRHALDGIRYAVKYEHNIIIMLLATFVVVSIGFLLQISAFEWLFCISIIGAIIATEMINSSIEAVVDLVTKEYNPLAKIAKDTASAASLILAITAFIGGCIIFMPKIIELIK